MFLLLLTACAALPAQAAHGFDGAGAEPPIWNMSFTGILLPIAVLLLAANFSLNSYFCSEERRLPRGPAVLQSPPDNTLLVISAGAVFLGTNSCIGNPRNLMVKSIAERNSAPMSGFFGYKG